MEDRNKKERSDTFGRQVALSLLACFFILGLPVALSIFSFQRILDEGRSGIVVHAEELELTYHLGNQLKSTANLLTLRAVAPSAGEGPSLTTLDAEILATRMKLTALKPDARSLQLLDEIGRSMEDLKTIQFPARPVGFLTQLRPITEDLLRIYEVLAKHQAERFQLAKTRVERMSNQLVTGLIVAASAALVMLVVIAGLLAHFFRVKKIRDLRQIALFKREKQLSQARKEAVEIVSHNLKNPLASILLSVELLDRKAKSETVGDIRGNVQSIHKATTLMSELIEDLLDQSRIESGRMKLSLKFCKICGLVEGMYDRLRLLASSRGVTLELKDETGGVELECDRARLEQVLNNLVGNAVKRAPAGGKVATKIVVSGTQSVLITVSDMGTQLESGDLRHVFDRYWKSKVNASQHSSGVGMSLVKGIVEAHGGSVWAERIEAQGTCFYLRLPLTSRPGETPRKRSVSTGELAFDH